MAAGILGGLFSLGGSVLTANANKAIAREQMDFQRDMSNTAYQRAIADMRTAGLNPMLAAKLGGASTPPGAAIPVNYDLGSITEGFQEGLSAYQQQKVFKEETDARRAQAAGIEWNAKSAEWDSDSKRIARDISQLHLDFYKRNPWMIALEHGTSAAGPVAGAAGNFLTKGLAAPFKAAKDVLRRRR